MKIHHTRFGMLVAALALVGAAACAPPKIMIKDEFIPGRDKVARSMVQQTHVGGDDEVDLSDYFIEVCEIENAKAATCNTSLVLRNVTNWQFTNWND